MRTANAMGDVEDADDVISDTEDRIVSKEGRKLKKYLRQLEKNNVYESDGDENPYMTEESDDSAVENKSERDTATQEKDGVDPKKDKPKKSLRTDGISSSGKPSPAGKRSSSGLHTHSTSSSISTTPVDSLKLTQRASINQLRSKRPYVVTFKLGKDTLTKLTSQWPPAYPTLADLVNDKGHKKRHRLDIDSTHETSAGSADERTIKKIKIKTSASPPTVKDDALSDGAMSPISRSGSPDLPGNSSGNEACHLRKYLANVQ